MRALWLLRRHAARQDIARQQSPLEPVVYDVEWERVGFLLDAQARAYESAADLVASAYAAGREAHRKRQQITDEMATYPNYNADMQASVLDEATRRAAQVQDLRETALQQKLFWHGGMPGFHEVGTLGDLMVKHALLRTRDSIREVQKRYTFPSDAVSGDAEGVRGRSYRFTRSGDSPGRRSGCLRRGGGESIGLTTPLSC